MAVKLKLTQKSDRRSPAVRLLMFFAMLGFAARSFLLGGNRKWIVADVDVLAQGQSSLSSQNRHRQTHICNNTGTGRYDEVWSKLCELDFVYTVDRMLSLNQSVVRIIQIGAHVGFEENDPLAEGMLRYLDLLSEAEQKRFQWTFVEPSVPNFKALRGNIANYSHLADLCAIHAGVVADSSDPSGLTFYSIRDTIDPVTGFDSLSNKTFPYWITQISSFSMAPINHNRRIWARMGLKMNDYVVATKVPTKKYSDLVKEILQGDEPSSSLVLVLLDTEGFDCPIINGIAKETVFVPHFLVFEDKQCTEVEKATTNDHLNSMGYTLYSVHENTVAHKKPL
eukprot:scaffold22560_cov135-Cylindrotheca_fusiformis.AAC.3